LYKAKAAPEGAAFALYRLVVEFEASDYYSPMTSEEYYDKKLKRLPNPEARSFPRTDTDYANVKKVHIVGVCGTARV
jgi:hypothetical protein